MDDFDVLIIDEDKNLPRQLYSTLRAQDCTYAHVTSCDTAPLAEALFNKDYQAALISMHPRSTFLDFERVLELIHDSSEDTDIIALIPQNQLGEAIKKYEDQIYDFLLYPCEVNKACRGISSLLSLKKIRRDNRLIVETNTRLGVKPDEMKKRASQLSYYYRQFGVLRELIYSMVVTGEVYNLIEKTPDIINKILPYDKLAFFLADADGEQLSLVVSRGVAKAKNKRFTFALGKGIAGHVASSKEAVVCKNRLEHEAFVKLHDKDPSPRTLMASPLRVKGKVIGVVVEERDLSKGAYSKYDLDFFNTIAAQISVGIENARIYRSIREGNIELERRIKELTTMFDISRAVQQILDDLHALFFVIVQKVARVLEVERCSIMQLDEEGDTLSIQASVGIPDDIVESTVVKVGNSISGLVAKQGSPLLIRDVETDAVATKINQEQYYTHSCMCVPVKVKGDVVGVINVSNKRSKEVFSQEDLNLLVAIATTVGQTIENRRLLKDLMAKEGEKLKLKESFQKYVAPQVVEQILNNPDFVSFQGRRQTVTVLMVGIANFSQVVWQLVPGEVVGLLNEYLSEMTKVIFKHHGTLDKFIGDTVMSVFGAPIPRPDAPLAASRAAVEMIQVFEKLIKKWEQEGRAGREFQIRAAITSGEAVVGNIGSTRRLEYTVIGDTVNTCARFKSVAKGGQIIIGEETVGIVPAEEFSTTALEAVELKGKAEKTKIFLLKGKEGLKTSAEGSQQE